MRRFKMKKRFLPIIPITVGLILISGLVYAMDKKKHAKPVGLMPETMTEEEALKTELLEATEDHENKLPAIGDARSKKIVPEKTRDQIANQPKK
jgi:hypothetical protein